MSSVSAVTGMGENPLDYAPVQFDVPHYDGARAKIFGLAFILTIITILSFGIGRFWMITRLRRHYWSSIRIGGDPFEYTGKALELLLGFMMALIIIAVYLIVVNIGLYFIGFSHFEGNSPAFLLPLVALLPLGFWARYRAMQYVLTRTRWRGVRFGLMPGAWGYMWRAIGLWALTFLTLGFLYPLMQITQARYVTERTRYGSLAFRQEGRWQVLLKSWLWVWLALPTAILFKIFIMPDSTTEMSSPISREGSNLLLIIVFSIWISVTLLRHRVVSFRYLNSNKVLRGETRFYVNLKTAAVVDIVGSACILIAIIGTLTVIFLSIALPELVSAGGQSVFSLARWINGDIALRDASGTFIAAGMVIFPSIAVFVALIHALLIHPLLKGVIGTTHMFDLQASERAKQRDHDEQPEAGGFADALDVG